MLHLSLTLTCLIAAAPVERSAEPAPADGPAVTVGGIVQTPEGQAIAGAQIVLRAKIGGQQYFFGVTHNRDVLARTTSDEKGEFAFEKIAIPPRLEDTIETLLRGKGGAEVIVWSEGRGIAWTDVEKLATEEPLKIALAPEADVRGTVQDESGRGIAGVRIRLAGASPASGELDLVFRKPGDIYLMSSEIAHEAVSADDGRFVFHHLPRDYRLAVMIEHPGFKYLSSVIDTGTDRSVSEVKYGNRGKPMPLLRSPLSINLDAVRKVTVRVADHAGNPVSGGAIQVIDSERHFAGWADVDERGEARISVSKPGKYEFQYGGDPLQPVLGSTASAELPEDSSTPTVEIRLPEPRWITGRVADADTGAGLAGAYVGFWREPQPGGQGGASAIAVSTADGSFRLPAATGTVKLWVGRSLHGYLTSAAFQQLDPSQPSAVTTVEIPETGDIEPVSLSVARGLVVRGIVRDKEGNPLAGVAVHGQNIDRPFKRANATTDAEGRFELAALSPHAKTIVTVAGEAGAFFQRIDGEPTHPWNKTRVVELPVTLNAGVSLFGRVTFGGKPRAGVRMVLMRTFADEKNRYYPGGETVTDQEGRYRVAGLLPGDQYMFEIRDPDGMVAAGWTHQSPYGHTVAEGKAEIELPEAQLVSCRQRLQGVVVNPMGMPVAGITVSASLAEGRGSLSRMGDAPPPWTVTDEQGRFALSQLPDEPIELMAYRANPMGGPILYPARVRPQPNQQDIRIIFDPKLTQEVEDLDAPEPKATRGK